MKIVLKESSDWDAWEKDEILSFISVPEYNGGYSLQGASLQTAWEALPSRSLAVWLDGTPTLCLSILPIDEAQKTGIFHVSGDGRLSAQQTQNVAVAWLSRLTAKEGFSIRAFTQSKAVMRWGRRLGFDVWGQSPTGDWVGQFNPHT